MVRFLRILAIIVAAIVVAGVVTLSAAYLASTRSVDQAQTTLDPFYDVPNPLPPGQPGQILKSEPLGQTLNNANAYRVLYRTAMPDGTPRVSGAMLFVPTTPAPPGGRKVVSWAHPTVGMGKACAPSRVTSPLDPLTWLQEMLDRGWIVTATDYAGLATTPPEYYLIGQNEAIDVVNAVRMAREFPNAQASNQYAVYGHSQGGHASLWTGSYGPSYAPELKLVGVSAAAPAAELIPLVDELWDSAIGWVIGTEALISYPLVYPSLSVDAVTTSVGQRTYQDVAQDCLQMAGLTGLARTAFDQNLFNDSPSKNPAWRTALEAQSTPALPATMPALVIESTSDGVVLPNTIALMQRKWCKAGSRLQVDWLGPLSNSAIDTHGLEGKVGGPLAIDWIAQRFDGLPAPTNCNVAPAVKP
ncbi:MAG: lipase family protein [Actinomycetes bacterium]